ncbi:DNA polymerase delta subunit 3 isoform X1 [Leptinotarsa decemlineata]|uniref:DNA polymerase delta subunit 3 isoform X1 n=1 Tax=Leptinotarsa decemlineata TaxID=7539 RepID=UPI003D3098F9
MEPVDNYFKKIEEWIEDNEKIVTVPYLAMTFHLSIQNTQKIVEEFVDSRKKFKQCDITVTYILRGFLNSSKGKGVFIVSEFSLPAKRKLFEKVEDEVVFSIQKSKNIDFNVISLVANLGCIGISRSSSLLGCIVGDNCSKRNKIKKSSLAPVETSAKYSESAEIKRKICSEAVPNSGTVDVSNKAAALVINKDVPKTTAVAPLINKDVPKTTSIRDNKCKKGKSGISNFFKAVPSKNSSDIKSTIGKEENAMETEDNPIKVESEGKDTSESPRSFTEVPNVEKEFRNQQVSPTTSKTKEKTNKRRRKENMENNSKKRKRIVERSDSESDDMFEKIADDDIIEKSDDEPEPVLSHVKKSLEPKNKRRKAIDKTYQDDEGFIGKITKTEYVYETASEDENEAPREGNGETSKVESKKGNSVSIKDNSLQKNSAKVKTEKKNTKQNQPTLMNFFKKK